MWFRYYALASAGALVKYLEDTQKVTCAAKTLRVFYQGSEATAIIGTYLSCLESCVSSAGLFQTPSVQTWPLYVKILTYI